MILKRSLSAALVFSISMSSVMTPHLAFAQDNDGWNQSASSDTINIILEAMAERDPVRAKSLLEKAKQAAAHEKLPARSLETINALLSSAQMRLKSQGSLKDKISSDSKISFNLDGITASPSDVSKPLTPDQQTILAELLKQNPDLRQTLREVELGRTTRDANPARLNEIVFAETSKTVDQHDATNSANDLALSDAGEFVAALRALKLIKDYSALNRAMRAKYDSLSIDELAWQIVKSTSTWSMGLGAVKNTIAASGLSWRRNLAGVSIEALGNFVLNANLILRLADLYGVQLDETQQDVLIVTSFMGAKLTYFLVKNRAGFKAIAEKVGERFAEAKSAKTPGAMAKFVMMLLRVPLISKSVQNVPGLAQLQTGIRATEGLGSAVAADIKGLQAPLAAPGATPVAPAAPGAPVAVAAPAAPIAAEAGEAVVAKEAAAAKAEKSLKFTWLLGSAIKGAVQSGAETAGIGMFSMMMLGRAKKRERELDTKQFRAYLMSNKGEGFIKLLILAMNTSNEVPDVLDVRKTMEPKANFILNIARSTKVCSPQDLTRYSALLRLQTANARAGKRTDVTNSLDYKLLRFDCDSKLSAGRYNRMAKEFLTFNAIPQRYTDLLRTASYENRLRMGELIMQLQFLDGDQDEKEAAFFDQTVLKLLGLSRAEDMNYFDRFLQFVRQNGGMTENRNSPTGYSVDSNNIVSPFNDVDSYSPLNGPDSPLAPVIALPTPTTTGATTTITPTSITTVTTTTQTATPPVRPTLPAQQPMIPKAIIDAQNSTPFSDDRR